MKNRTIVFILFFFVGCLQGSKMILKLKDVQSFNVQILDNSPGLQIEISGLVFHSSLAAEGIETKIDNDRLDVMVHLVAARNGLSGNFDYKIDVAPSVKFIYFGEEKQLIWQRGVGIIK